MSLQSMQLDFMSDCSLCGFWQRCFLCPALSFFFLRERYPCKSLGASEETSLVRRHKSFVVVMASLFQCEDLCDVLRVLSVDTILRSSEYSTPIQSHFCHSMPGPDLPASTATAVPSSSVYSPSYIQSRSDTYNFDAEHSEDEASKDFWGEFVFSGLSMNQRGVDEINHEVEDDQMGRPVMASRKRHKGILGGVTEFDPTV